MITKLIFTMLLMIVLLPAYAAGRAPAVQPVSGISIDDYKEVPPSQAKGYEFAKGKPKAINRQTASNINLVNIENKSSKQVYGSDASWPLSIFLFILISLPFALWFTIMKSLGQKDRELPTNTLQFPNKSPNDDDDLDYPKAS